MRSRKTKNPFIDAAFTGTVVFGLLWGFDRPVARKLLGYLGWVGGVVVVVTVGGVALILLARRLRRQPHSAIGAVPGVSRTGESGESRVLRGLLDRDPPLDRPGRAGPVAGAAGVKPDGWSLELVKALEWKRFEMLCAGYFEAKGYHPETTRIGADGGIDVIFHRKGDPDGRIFGVVQCKAWSRAPVGIKLVRELFGVKAAEEAPLAVFITTTDYTKEAKAFAEGKHIELIPGEKLVELLRGLPEPSSSELLSKVTTGDYMTPTCPRCDTKMILRTSRKGDNPGSQFWGCRNYPRCRQTLRLPSHSS